MVIRLSRYTNEIMAQENSDTFHTIFIPFRLFLGDRSKSKQDTKRTNRTQFSEGKYEFALFWVPALIL